jgi:gamma-glutamyltranspeptidase/glutathione hydrolase
MSSTEVFTSAAVAAPHQLAATAGRDVFAMGGNAVEAMVAMASTIAVVYPHMNAIGGDGFWLVREPKGKVRAFEGCGPAGRLAIASRYRDLGYDAIPSRGPLAALTVPGAIGGWALALDYAKSIGGRMPLRDLLAHAIKHAHDGYPVSPSEVRCKPIHLEALKEAPGFARTYLVEGKWPEAGALRSYPVLAATLDQLANAGLDDFYRGDVGREMAADLERIGSPVTRADLEQFQPRVREPLALPLAGRTLYNFPPPTQGLASLLILGMFERLGVKRIDTFEHTHALVEATKRAFAIRDRVCLDPAFTDEKAETFLTPRVLEREAAVISMSRAATLPLPQAKGDTVWMGAIDGDGLAVSYIQSVYWEYGSGCVLPTTGVLMQNRGISFSLDPASHHALRPGRKPFHTLNPAMAAFDDGRVMPYGTMGGDGQPQVQAQVFTRIDRGIGLAEALDAPRFVYGRTWGAESSRLNLENRVDPTLLRALEKAGHEVAIHADPYSEAFGHAGALMRHRNGRVEAAHDPRSDGGAAGL